MEIDLQNFVWPICVMKCNEALLHLRPGEALTIDVADPDVVRNIILLIKSRRDLHFNRRRRARLYRIRVRRNGG
jgi:TusA-related sulfurtransferase